MTFCFGPPEFGPGHLTLSVTGPTWTFNLQNLDLTTFLFMVEPLAETLCVCVCVGGVGGGGGQGC